MISHRKPESKTLSPKNLYDILCSDEDKNVNVIESIIQRELVWTYDCIETFWTDILECIRINTADVVKTDILSGRRVFDKAWMVAGNIEYSTIDACNEKRIKQLQYTEHKSLVDGSQRNRISMFILVALLYENAKMQNYATVDLSPIKLSNGEYKLIEVGANNLEKFYNKIETTPVEELKKEIAPLEKLTRRFSVEGQERDYFDTFALYVNFIERDIIGTYDLMDVISIIMHNIYFYEEFIEGDYKFDRFTDRNRKTTPMADVHMYPKSIINRFDPNVKDDILKAFNRFKNRAEEAQKINEYKNAPNKAAFRKTKNGVGAVLYIMIEMLKIKLAQECNNNTPIDKESVKKNVFSSTFELTNIDFGIDKCFLNKYVFNTADDAIKYFEDCYDFADFLLTDAFTRHATIQEDCYYLRDFAKQDVLWWYFMKPCYIADRYIKDSNPKRFSFIKDLFTRVYFFYIVHKSSDTNSQNLISLLEKISFNMLTFNGTNEEFETLIKSYVKNYIDSCGGYNELKNLVASLSYGVKSHKGAIENIFIAMEYDICKKFSLPTDIFYTLWKRDTGKPYNLDHWYPEKLFKELDNSVEYNQIGNLVLLEEPLNKSKQDSTEVNSKYYTQSKYVQTLLLDKTNRGTFYNKVINAINDYPYFTRVTEDEINNPTLENIRKRTRNYVDFFVDFIKNFIGDGEEPQQKKEA